MRKINLITTIERSLLEKFFPRGWNLKKIEGCCNYNADEIFKRENWWNSKFEPIECDSIETFNTLMGYEIAKKIKESKDEGREIAIILSVGPMGMYRWAVEFLKMWNVDCKHVHGFNMDEWCDSEGNTLPSSDRGAFQNAMEGSLYGPLGKLSVPKKQRHFATKESIYKYGEQIFNLKDKGAKLIVVYGIGWDFHIAFWEPHFAEEYSSTEEWKKPTHRISANLHPITIIQNSVTSFKSRITLVPAKANTIGPGLFLKADYTIGGVDGYLPSRGMIYQGAALWVTLKYGPDIWVPSSFMPTLPGKLFFIKELAGPLEPEVN